MDGKTACYYNDSPNCKMFELFAQSSAEETGRTLYKVTNDYIVIGCLTPATEGFFNMIDKIPQQLPREIYFYSILKEKELEYFRNVTIIQKPSSKAYKFRVLITDTMKTVNDKFKNERDPNDKTPFVYQINGSELSSNKQLCEFPQLEVVINAIPKLVQVQVWENDSLIFNVKFGISFLKKTAREMLEKVIAIQLERDPEEFKNYEVFYEHNHKRISEDSGAPVKVGDYVKLHLLNKNKLTGQTVEVPVVMENGQEIKKQLPLNDVQFKVPSEMASSVVNSDLLKQKELSRNVDNVSLVGPTEFFKEGKTINIKIITPHSHEPLNYEIKSPVVPSAYQTQQYLSFKVELKKILDQVDSDQNDTKIKKLIAEYMISQICK